MIIARITGGLGNQLFQYAAGRRLAYVHNTELKLDVTEVRTKSYRPYLLDKFSIRTSIATPQERAAMLGMSRWLPEEVEPLVHRHLHWFSPCVLREAHFHFDERLLKAGDNTYLIGYWQSEKYFADIAGRLRRDLTLKKPLSAKSRDAQRRIQRSVSVAVTVRRGDFVTDPTINARHGVLPPSYYQRAADSVARQVSDPTFYVFSDDIAWVKQHIPLPYRVIYLDFNFPQRIVEDLALIASCKHAILSNSTFSWWGAWLINTPDKIIIAPSHWFNLPYSTQDLFPKEWITI